jgi:predicted dehydrogenase
MNIGVLGLGFMGGTHLQAFSRIPDARVAAVMSRNQARLSGDLSDMQGNLGIKGAKMDFSGVRKYTAVDDLLADPGIDAVDICLPTNLHAPVALRALNAGKHVLLEKPMALDGESATRIVEAARRQGKVLMVAHVLRFMAPYRALADLVRSGRLGRVRSAIFRRRTAVPEWGAWEFDRDQSGGGVYDLLIHDVDMALHLFGTPVSVSSTGFENLRGGIDMITSDFQYANVDSVTITGGWHHKGGYPFSMEYTIVGDEGVAEFSSSGRPATVFWKNGTQETIPVTDADPYTAEIAYFIKCCRSGHYPDLCPPEDSAAAVRAALLMVSAREHKGKRVPWTQQMAGASPE